MNKTILILAAALALAGCNDPDVKAGGAKIAIGAKVAADGAVQATKKGVEKAGEATTQTVMSTKVHAALRSAEGLDDSDIDVDTVKDTVFLEGSVPTQAEKDKAERIATDIAGKGYKITNNLAIKSKTS